MAGHGAKSDAARALAALRLAAGGTLAEAAADSGAAGRTVERWLTVPSFRQEVDRLRAALLERACGQTVAHMTEAAATLQSLLSCRNLQVRLGAARSLLQLGVLLKQAVDDARRLDELERRLGAIPGGRGAEQPGADERAAG